MASEELEADEYELYALGLQPHYIHEMKFNTSFDWIMPVVRKLTVVSNNPFTITQFNKYIYSRIQKSLIYKANAFYVGGTIQEVFDEVVEVIEWCNINILNQKP